MPLTVDDLQFDETYVDYLSADPVLSSLYEPIQGEQWERFIESIKQNGVREPLKVLQVETKLILWDGYQRLRALKQLGINRVIIQFLPDEWSEWDDEQKVSWAADYNENRRHLSKLGQARVYLANKNREPGNKPTEKPKREEAAKQAGFGSVSSAERAGRIAERSGPELQDAWATGEVSDATADEIAREPVAEQPQKLRKAREKRNDEPKPDLTETESLLVTYDVITQAVLSLRSKMDRHSVILQSESNVELIKKLVAASKPDAVWSSNVRMVSEALIQLAIEAETL